VINIVSEQFEIVHTVLLQVLQAVALGWLSTGAAGGGTGLAQLTPGPLYFCSNRHEQHKLQAAGRTATVSHWLQ